MGVKLKADYGAVLHMPILKEGKDRVSQLPGSMHGQQIYTQPGEGQTNAAALGMSIIISTYSHSFFSLLKLQSYLHSLLT